MVFSGSFDGLKKAVMGPIFAGGLGDGKKVCWVVEKRR